MVMVNLGSTDDSRYTGYREITDRDVLDLQCIGNIVIPSHFQDSVECRASSCNLDLSGPDNIIFICTLINAG